MAYVVLIVTSGCGVFPKHFDLEIKPREATKEKLLHWDAISEALMRGSHEAGGGPEGY